MAGTESVLITDAQNQEAYIDEKEPSCWVLSKLLACRLKRCVHLDHYTPQQKFGRLEFCKDTLNAKGK